MKPRLGKGSNNATGMVILKSWKLDVKTGFLDGNTPQKKKKHGFSWFTKILPHRHNGGDWDPLRGSIYVGGGFMSGLSGKN